VLEKPLLFKVGTLQVNFKSNIWFNKNTRPSFKVSLQIYGTIVKLLSYIVTSSTLMIILLNLSKNPILFLVDRYQIWISVLFSKNLEKLKFQLCNKITLLTRSKIIKRHWHTHNNLEPQKFPSIHVWK